MDRNWMRIPAQRGFMDRLRNITAVEVVCVLALVAMAVWIVSAIYFDHQRWVRCGERGGHKTAVGTGHYSSTETMTTRDSSGRITSTTTVPVQRSYTIYECHDADGRWVNDDEDAPPVRRKAVR